MSLDLLGEGFDLHAGGQDLRFPHHENERAQAVALGKTFANHWMHNGFVVDAEGEKMSKSLGNVSNLLDLIDVYDPRAYRMVLLQSHYRSPVKITSDSIGAAINSLAGLDSFAARTRGLAADATSDPDVLAEFRAAMDDDLDTPRATALIFDTVRRANAAFDAGDPAAAALAAAVHEICDAVGLELGVADRRAGRRARLGDRARRGPGRRATSSAPTRSVPSCRPADGPSRRPKTVRRFAGDGHDRTIRVTGRRVIGGRLGDGRIDRATVDRPRRCRPRRGSCRRSADVPEAHGLPAVARRAAGAVGRASCSSTTPGSRGCTAGSSASRCSSSCPGS